MSDPVDWKPLLECKYRLVQTDDLAVLPHLPIEKHDCRLVSSGLYAEAARVISEKCGFPVLYSFDRCTMTLRFRRG